MSARGGGRDTDVEAHPGDFATQQKARKQRRGAKKCFEWVFLSPLSRLSLVTARNTVGKAVGSRPTPTGRYAGSRAGICRSAKVEDLSRSDGEQKLLAQRRTENLRPAA